MTTLDAITEMASESSLQPLGALHENRDTLILLGPKEPGFWARITASPEWADKDPDPIDRWSERVIGAMADTLGGIAHFPFEREPYLPFYRWSLETGALWPSPVHLLVHGEQGLMVSIRGALRLPLRMDLPDLAPSPCTPCAAPCTSACPVGAMTSGGYDVDACHAYLETPEGLDCMENGCRVRLSCPAGANYGRLKEQSAYHMAQFHK